MKKSKLCGAFVLAALILTFGPVGASAETLREDVQRAIDLFEEKDSGMEHLFATSYAYAVYPKVGKGGIGVGGARGHGLVYKGGELVGETSLTQFTVGLQLGGQVYQEVIFFEDQRVFDSFTKGNYEFSAQVSAIAAAAGASADAAYKHGVLVFTLGKAGLMYEASIGGQKLGYRGY